MGGDGTERKQISLLTSGFVCDFENSDGTKTRTAFTARSAYITPGKTAQIEADAVVEHALENGARYLQQWRDVHEKKFPGVAHTIPDPSEVGLHRLGAGGLLITDTCAQALCFLIR